MLSVHLHSDQFPQPVLPQLCSCNFVSKVSWTLTQVRPNIGKYFIPSWSWPSCDVLYWLVIYVTELPGIHTLHNAAFGNIALRTATKQQLCDSWALGSSTPACEEQMAAFKGSEGLEFMAALWNFHTADLVWKDRNKEQDMTLQFLSFHLHCHETWKELVINISEQEDMFSSLSLNHSVTGGQTFFLTLCHSFNKYVLISSMSSWSIFCKMDLGISHLWMFILGWFL